MNLDKIVFKDDDFEMEVIVSKEDKTCWLTQEEITKLFGRKRQTITYHLSNSLDDFRQKCSTSVEIFDKSIGRPSKRYSMGVVKCIGEKLKSNRGVALEKYIKDYFVIKNTNDSDDIIVYNNGNIKLAVSVSPLEETIWLSVNQIAMLFETTVQNIYSHIKNIRAEGEVGHSVLKKSLNTGL